ncbi:LPS export ABC transporter permease LptG [Ahniella affigens]|nr:LPS export ABC transporter permease LptG [Ahniella affigens]
MRGIKRADWLILRAVASSLALSWLVLVGIDTAQAFANEMDEIGSGNYDLMTAVTYTAWTVPRRFYELFPMAAVLAAVVGLGSLAPTSELTALRAAGMSKLRISAPVILLLLLVGMGVTSIGETLAAFGEHQAQSVQAGAKSRDLVVTSRTGMWARDGAYLLNARSGKVEGGELVLIDARLYEFDPQGRLLGIVRAEKARNRDGVWRFETLRRFGFTKAKVSSTTEASWVWQSKLDPRLMTLGLVQPRYQAVKDLRRHIDYLLRNGLDASEFLDALWTRFAYPLRAIAPAFLALPFAFGFLRSGGLGKRIMIGAVIGLTFYFFSRMLGDLAGVYGFNLAVANLVPPILLMLASMVHLARSR